MRAKTCTAALLACAACSADRLEPDGGWPIVRGPEPTAGDIAQACIFADREHRDERLAQPEALFPSYAVRNPVCTTERLRLGRTQCSFELGRTRSKLFHDPAKAARRANRWRMARASFTYRRVGAGHDWTESWWADGPCL